jgi:tetratricopeptide (TPR) repeat protein
MTKHLLLAATLFLGALPATAQTASEQLQGAIFAQDSQGNLDAAIATYRQLAYSGLTPRDVAAEAQYRLGQALLAKGDITAATREFERMERDFPDYQQMVSRLAAARHGALTPAPAPAAAGVVQGLLKDASHSRFDAGLPVSFRGKVTQILWQNPRSVMVIDTGAQKYLVQLTTPMQIIQQGGTRNMFTLGDEVVVQGIQPNQGRLIFNDMEAVQANVINAVDGRVMFDWSKVPESARAPLEPVK